MYGDWRFTFGNIGNLLHLIGHDGRLLNEMSFVVSGARVNVAFNVALQLNFRLLQISVLGG